MSIKFVGKPHLIFMVKIKGLEGIFSENVILLKDRGKKKFRKTTRLIRIKFVGKLCLIFTGKN